MDRAGFDLRKLIGLLFTLNLGVFLAGMALQSWAPDAPAPLVFNAEKIRLLALSPAAPPAKVETVAPVVPASALPAAPPAPAANMRCLSWPSLDTPGFLAIEARLSQAGIAADTYEIELEKQLGWWVFLPPRENKVEVQATLDEISRLGVTDFALVRGGSMRNAVSLGAFAKLSQARQHAARMAGKGIKGVKLGPRPEAGTARLVVSASIAENTLAKLQATWPKEMKPTACALP